MTLFQLFVVCLAPAADETSYGGVQTTFRSRGIEVTVRSLTGEVRVLTDDRGGWRMERYFSGHRHLVSAEDSYGPLVDVTRDVDGRTTGVLLAKRYALEYFYDGPHDQWNRKILYEPRSGEVLAHVVNARPAGVGRTDADPPLRAAQAATVLVDDRLYAIVPEDSEALLIRGVEIDDPASGTVLDRFDYTETHLVVHLGGGEGDLPKVVAIPRHIHDSSKPQIVEVGEPDTTRYDVVWSLTGRQRNTSETTPHLKGALPPAVEQTLRDAFPLALERVRKMPTCRALFENFVTSGNRRLSDSLYASPGNSGVEQSCTTGAAYTHVHSPITRLCPGFGGLNRDQAAIVLIHEALHFAGLGEAPFYADAPTSGEINLLVQQACGF